MVQNSEQRVIEIIVNGSRAEASIKEMQAAAKVLWNQLAKLSADDPNRAKLIADYQKMKGNLDEATKAARGMDSTMNSLRQSLSGVVPLITACFIVNKVIRVLYKLIQSSQRIREIPIRTFFHYRSYRQRFRILQRAVRPDR